MVTTVMSSDEVVLLLEKPTLAVRRGLRFGLHETFDLGANRRFADAPVPPTPYGRCVMPSPDLSAIRYIDVEASLVTFCSWCRHSEFVHSNRGSGVCLFSECRCPHFFPHG